MEVSLAVTPTRSDALDGLDQAVEEELPSEATLIDTTTRMFAFSLPELRLTVTVEDSGSPLLEESLSSIDKVETVYRTAEAQE